MAGNKFDNNWQAHHGTLIKWTLVGLVAAVLLFSLFKGCTQVGKSSGKDVYVPDRDHGFVMKANRLLQHLVDQGNTDHPQVHPHSLTELQQRYPALRFALPYDENDVEGARAADIRLVGIDVKQIKDEDDVTFFLNSDIPSLLERQQAHLGERMFRIRFATAKSKDGLVIERIEVLPGMFKVALVKDPWVGAVTCADNALFPTSNHCFVTWGQSVVPVRLQPGGHLHHGMQNVVRTDEKSRTLLTGSRKPIDYYRLFQSMEADSTTLCVRFPGQNEPAVYIDYLAPDSVNLRTTGCYCQPYGATGALRLVEPTGASARGQVYPLKDILKLVVSRKKDSERITQLTVTRHNPLLYLSMPTRTSEGRSRYTIPPSLTDKFTQQVIRGLSVSLSNTVYKDTVKLSLDPILSMEMEKELEAYAKTLMSKGKFFADDQWELSLTVMDMATGEVIAAPYYRSSDKMLEKDLALGRKNPALTRRFIGSSFKPLVALAAVLTDPSLDTLNTRGHYRLTSPAEGKKKGKAMFYGHPTTAWASKGSAQNFWGGCGSMKSFFAISDDVYPVALVSKALGYDHPENSPFDFVGSEVLLREKGNFTWAGSRFVSTLDHLYDIPGPKEYHAHDSLQMEYYTWDRMSLDSTSRFGLDNVSPDPTLFYFDNFSRSGATLHNELATWVLGQGTNEWNCLKLAEAWSRMLTKRRVRASFVSTRGKTDTESLAKGYDNQAWNSVLRSLRAAQSSHEKNLLWPMDDAVRKLNASEHITDSLLLFGKTGTPDNVLRMEWRSVKGEPKWMDIGIYCMGLMPASAYRSVQADQGGSGLMCVMRVTRMVSRNHRNAGSADGIQSSDARNFFSSYPQRLRKFYQLTKPYFAPKQTQKKNK